MPDETPVGEQPQEGAAGTEPQAGTEDTPTPGGNGGNEQPEEGDTPKDGDDSQVKALRAEAAKHRREKQDALKKVEELEREKMGESERKDRDLKAATERSDELVKRLRVSAVKLAAVAEGVKPEKVERVHRFVDLETLGDADDLDAIEDAAAKAVRGLRKTDADIFTEQTPAGDGGKGNGRGASDDDNVSPGYGQLVRAYETSGKT